MVINGTCLDYLAESFMAGDPLDGGGFVILNGVKLDAGEAALEAMPEGDFRDWKEIDVWASSIAEVLRAQPGTVSGP